MGVVQAKAADDGPQTGEGPMEATSKEEAAKSEEG
jgi:hypothetical protein